MYTLGTDRSFYSKVASSAVSGASAEIQNQKEAEPPVTGHLRYRTEVDAMKLNMLLFLSTVPLIVREGRVGEKFKSPERVRRSYAFGSASSSEIDFPVRSLTPPPEIRMIMFLSTYHILTFRVSPLALHYDNFCSIQEDSQDTARESQRLSTKGAASCSMLYHSMPDYQRHGETESKSAYRPQGTLHASDSEDASDQRKAYFYFHALGSLGGERSWFSIVAL
ncbi:uncharacterized protein FOMMEDRAFT_154169 [Fomitiporia mediterranea MF3/22]|uniref:uncharacterized protein n=1 Tax=Fomitiporia mediterranea (strain MF3/22) TaxID=694068 RepID=UPI0004407DCF|nr:uncharacterized protein FOMMEDRAFT_154169 [Fomitiporia mediterranea MF3/22]EJD05009.1 hypothetical protein FOMMEDRAFT_154169 [Fomitiporia mediterranea MF3/22]